MKCAGISVIFVGLNYVVGLAEMSTCQKNASHEKIASKSVYGIRTIFENEEKKTKLIENK